MANNMLSIQFFNLNQISNAWSQYRYFLSYRARVYPFICKNCILRRYYLNYFTLHNSSTCNSIFTITTPHLHLFFIHIISFQSYFVVNLLPYFKIYIFYSICKNVSLLNCTILKFLLQTFIFFNSF